MPNCNRCGSNIANKIEGKCPICGEGELVVTPQENLAAFMDRLHEANIKFVKAYDEARLNRQLLTGTSHDYKENSWWQNWIKERSWS